MESEMEADIEDLGSCDSKWTLSPELAVKLQVLPLRRSAHPKPQTLNRKQPYIPSPFKRLCFAGTTSPALPYRPVSPPPVRGRVGDVGVVGRSPPGILEELVSLGPSYPNNGNWVLYAI